MSVSLLLDEMQAPVVAAALRTLGHDVSAVAEQDALRAMSDEDLLRWAGEHGRRIVTENVKDFAPLLRHAEESGRPATPVLSPAAERFPAPDATPVL